MSAARLATAIERILDVLIAAALVVMVAAMVHQVFARYVLERSIVKPRSAPSFAQSASMPVRRSRSLGACQHLSKAQWLTGRGGQSLSAKVRRAAGPDLGLPPFMRRFGYLLAEIECFVAGSRSSH